MACKILSCIVFFNIVVAVPLTNEEINAGVTQTNLRMASPSYSDLSLDHSIYKVPIPRNLNSYYQDGTQLVSPQEILASDDQYSNYQNNEGVKELKLPLSRAVLQDTPNKFQTRIFENPYQNVNSNNLKSPLFRDVLNARNKQNLNRIPPSLSHLNLQTKGSSTLQYVLSNPNLLRNILAPRPKEKQYTVVYPNGTIGYENKLDVIESRYPNHILINARELQGLSTASSEKQVSTSMFQPNLNNNISITKFDYPNNLNNSSSSAHINQNFQSKLVVNESTIFNTTVTDQTNKTTDSQISDYTQIKSNISNLSDTSSTFYTDTEQHENSNTMNSSNVTIINVDSNSTKEQLQIKDQKINQSENYNESKNINSITFARLLSLNETNYTDLSIGNKSKETKESESISVVTEKNQDSTISLDKADITTLNITNNTNIEISPENIDNLENILHSDFVKSDTEKDDLNENVMKASNTSIKDNHSKVSDRENATTELPGYVNMNHDSTNDLIQPDTTTTNGTYNILESKSNETNGGSTDIIHLSDVVDRLDDNNDTIQNGSGVYSQVVEVGKKYEQDDASKNIEGCNDSSLWSKTDKENIAKELFGEGYENPNVYFMFYSPPETELEKETKTTIYPNGTVVEEYIETRKDLDGGPTIKTIIIKTYNVGVDSPSACNCTSSKR